MIFFCCSILFSIDTVVIRAFIQSNIYLALKLETIHLHDKCRHSEVFAIDILDNLGGIHLRDAPTIDNVYRGCVKEKLPCKS